MKKGKEGDNKSGWKKIWGVFGPGFVTGSADDDPSGIATYTQVGAQFGMAQLWAAVLTWPMMIAVQEMVARIGMVAGEGLTAVVRKNYSKRLVWTIVILVVAANTINIGADIGAMADAMNLLFPSFSFSFWSVAFCFLVLFLEIYLSYKIYADILKWLSFSLLSYVLTLFLVTPDWWHFLLGVIQPKIQFSREFMLGFMAVFGTTISPYLFIWQSNEEVEEEIVSGRVTLYSRKGASDGELYLMRRDTVIGMTYSQIIMICIIATAANSFYKNGIFDIQTTAQAARALEPLAGKFALVVYSIGIIGTGLLAIPILSAAAAYAMSEAFRWSEGLNKKFYQAKNFYLVIIFSTLVGLGMNYLGLNPIKALFWSAVINGIVSIPLIWIIMAVSNNKKIMSGRVNGFWSNLFGRLALIVAILCVIMILVL